MASGTLVANVKPLVLWQFKYSHYSEKARWGLDYKQLAHTRRSLVPGTHIAPLLWKTGQRQVPVLELGDGEYITGSGSILTKLEELAPAPRLLPADRGDRDRALALAEDFDRHLGPALRIAWFDLLLEDPQYVASQLSVGFGAIEQSLFQATFALTRRVMAFELGIDARRGKQARAEVLALLDELEETIGIAGYLVGSAFSLADLTAAALWSPLVMPSQFPYPLLRPLPAAAEQWRAELLDRPGLRWVGEIYRRHRGSSAEVAAGRPA